MIELNRCHFEPFDWLRINPCERFDASIKPIAAQAQQPSDLVSEPVGPYSLYHLFEMTKAYLYIL